MGSIISTGFSLHTLHELSYQLIGFEVIGAGHGASQSQEGRHGLKSPHGVVWVVSQDPRDRRKNLHAMIVAYVSHQMQVIRNSDQVWHAQNYPLRLAVKELGASSHLPPYNAILPCLVHHGGDGA